MGDSAWLANGVPGGFDGQLALYALVDNVDEAQIRSALEHYGIITKVKVGGWPPALVHFTTHQAALDAIAGGAASVCKGLAPLYNELSYDQKGWCARDCCSAASPACRRRRSSPLPYIACSGAPLRIA